MSDPKLSSAMELIAKAEADKKKKTREAAKAAVDANTNSEYSRGVYGQSTTRNLKDFENLRDEIDTLKAFVNDPAKQELLVDNPHILENLKQKESQLAETESKLSTSLNSVKDLPQDVREEMAAQYVLDDLDKLRKIIDYIDFSGGYKKLDATFDTLPEIFDKDDLSDKARISVLTQLEEKNARYIQETKATSKTFDEDYKAWQAYYADLRNKAGVQITPGRTEERHIQIPGWNYFFDMAQSSDAHVLHAQALGNEKLLHQFTDLSNRLSEAGKINPWFGKLKKKLALVDSKMPNDPEMKDVSFINSTADTIDSDIDKVLKVVSEKIKKGERMAEVYSSAKNRAPEIAALFKRTPYNSILSFEIRQHVQEKLGELKKQVGK